MANVDIVHMSYRIKSVREGLSKTLNLIVDMSQTIETVHEANAALQKRLDAAVRDINIVRDCRICKHTINGGPCRKCVELDTFLSCFEWRGEEGESK